jgi:hypothetical protein
MRPIVWLPFKLTPANVAPSEPIQLLSFPYNPSFNDRTEYASFT